MKNLKSIENPLFLSSRMYQYGNFWVINGFSFTADSEKKYALYQEVSVFGSLCRDCKIHANWKFFQIDNNGIFKEVGNYFDHELLNTESLELTSEEVDMIQKYSQQNSLCPVDAKSLVSTKLTPFVEQKTAFVKIKFAKIIEFNEGELVEFIKEVNDLLHELKDLYPLSYVKLVSIKAEIKKQYAKLKYPELYIELEKVENDKEYMFDENDRIVGFGYRSVFDCYSRYFDHYLLQGDIHKYHSPLEPEKSLLF